MSKPLIGISSGYSYDDNRAYVKNGYYDGIIKAGGLPILLPVISELAVIDEIMDRCDGFLLSGGPDLDAKLYGECNLDCNGDISPLRDLAEIHIARKAVELEKPLFGICRGIQVMNVALGGTLYQDIHTQVKETMLIKHSQSAPTWYPTHEIQIEKGSRVENSFGSSKAEVNSFHHQAVKDAAKAFAITSKASDGIIESIEHVSHRFAVGVQWHPELMWQQNTVFLRLFEDFVNACKI